MNGNGPAKPGWRATEFWLTAASLSFAMWAGYYALTHPEVELERLLAIMGAVGAAAGLYAQQRSGVKREALLRPEPPA